MKRQIAYQEDPAVARRRALGRALFELRRAERDEETTRKTRRPRAKVKLEDRR
ncbi:MAG: hypothetical protein JJ896_10020 [Rhodothermales bacterium]|nr:hypothetical protein [Rhodothermales bacterium]MBO6779976.1 hypothetical protein [Rhodothermales bacterium]